MKSVNMSDLGGLDPGDYTGFVYDVLPIKQPSGSEELIGLSKNGAPYIKLAINVGSFGNIKSDLYMGRLKWFAAQAKVDLTYFAKPIKGGKAEIQFDAFKGMEVVIRAFNDEYTASDNTKKSFLKYELTPTGKFLKGNELKELIELNKDIPAKDDAPF